MSLFYEQKVQLLSRHLSWAVVFSQRTDVLQMVLEIIMTTGCLHIHIKISFEFRSASNISKKDTVQDREPAEDAERKHATAGTGRCAKCFFLLPD